MSPTTGANEDAQALRSLLENLARYGVRRAALTGGVAFSTWCTPRYTRDFDLCAVVPLSAVDKILARYDGMRVGSAELPDVLRFETNGWDVDVFVAKTPYYQECLERAVETTFFDVPVRVVTPEDLLIQKVIKLQTDKRKVLQDAADIRSLVSERQIDATYLGKWLAPDQATLLMEAAILAEEELVARLKAL